MKTLRLSSARVEILKTLYRDTNIIIFDEPTCLTQEIDELMQIITRLKEEGKTIVLTHKLKEIKAVADRYCFKTGCVYWDCWCSFSNRTRFS